MLRLDYVVACRPGGKPGGPSLTVEMAYIGGHLTENGRLFMNRNTGIKQLRPAVKEWMEQLGAIIRLTVRTQDLVFTPPLKVMVEGFFKDKRSIPDLHGCLKSVCDGVEAGLGINDRFYKAFTGNPGRLGNPPRLIITISNARKGGKK